MIRREGMKAERTRGAMLKGKGNQKKCNDGKSKLAGEYERKHGCNGIDGDWETDFKETSIEAEQTTYR